MCYDYLDDEKIKLEQEQDKRLLNLMILGMELGIIAFCIVFLLLAIF